jgi:hypothetical protein
MIICDFMVDVSITIVIGNGSAISTLKIRKITAINKNCSKNGSLADLLTSKLHLDGDLSSWYSKFLLLLTAVLLVLLIVL